MRSQSSLNLGGLARIAAVVLAGVAGVAAMAPEMAFGASPAPSWRVTTLASPTVVSGGVGSHGVYDIAVENVGGAASSGVATVRDLLPAGMTPEHVLAQPEQGPEGETPSCGVSGREVTCTMPVPIEPGGFEVVDIEFRVTGAVESPVNFASVSGGNAPSASSEAETRVGVKHEAGPAGVQQF
jgi:uncharacterized repeat protein (TIGR01451 family)